MSEDAVHLQSPRPKRRWGRLILLLLLGCVLVAACAAGGAVWYFLHTPPERPGRNVEVLIPPGYPLARLAAQLEEHNVVLDARAFLLLAQYREAGGSIRTGRFLVSTGWTPDQVLNHLTKGRPYLERITLPEGLAWWEVGKRLEAAGYVRYADFVSLIHDPAFLRHWGIPFDNAEGFLFPDTYLIMRPLELNRESARSVIGRLIDTFWRKTAAMWPEGRRPGPGQAELVRKVVTLASIVEKETRVPSERRRVAGVYENRLKRGMILQADPTVIYGIGQDFKPPLRRSQLDDARNTYNTYKHPGLPPGPICSPGLACLEAAMYPEEHSYLFFVASGDGSHRFNSSLSGHNRDVRAYRQQERNAARQKAGQQAAVQKEQTPQPAGKEQQSDTPQTQTRPVAAPQPEKQGAISPRGSAETAGTEKAHSQSVEASAAIVGQDKKPTTDPEKTLPFRSVESEKRDEARLE